MPSGEFTLITEQMLYCHIPQQTQHGFFFKVNCSVSSISFSFLCYLNKNSFVVCIAFELDNGIFFLYYAVKASFFYDEHSVFCSFSIQIRLQIRIETRWGKFDCRYHQIQARDILSDESKRRMFTQNALGLLK